MTSILTTDNPYFRQVSLLVRVLPVIARERCFALKGGTAINLFVRNLPRLSVDIDLAYLPSNGRGEALAAISAALERVRGTLEAPPFVMRATVGKREDGHPVRLVVSGKDARIKIEVNPVLRGAMFPERSLRLHPEVEMRFGFVEMTALSFADLFAGKIVAALDRQHPRDLFDVQLLMAAEGIDADLFQATLVYMLSHDGSLARLLNPRAKPLQDIYVREFANMTVDAVPLAALERTREELVAALHRRMDGATRDFLLSFKRGEPDWGYFTTPHVAGLPAIRWKLANLLQMSNSERAERVSRLKVVLDAIPVVGR